MSGDRIVYLDPQEQIWPGDPGQRYSLQSVKGTDMVVPFSGIEEFDYRKTTNYPKTIFRFPLREKASGLSRNTYTTESLSELIDELKEEAKFLLIFLRSVHTVEVVKRVQSRRCEYERLFRVQVATSDQLTLDHNRATFLTNLRTQHHSNPFKISKCITDVVKFDVLVTDSASEQRTRWLVANQVGSPSEQILVAAAKQHVFPWVGVAVELDTPASEILAGGRIFCFLPMPAETSSNLPVHVNGTFALNDDRRTIKWPAKERRNDPAARWNTMLVSECLSSCYHSLLKALRRHSVPANSFYQALPCIDTISCSHWGSLLKPLYKSIFQWKCLWSVRCEEWVSVSNATIINVGDDLKEVVEVVLVECGLKLVKIPNHIHDALQKYYERPFSLVSQKLVRSELRANPMNYKQKSCEEKLELLKYCLSDEQYSNLMQLELIPLANKKFQKFRTTRDPKEYLYVCSKTYPRKLLPNCDHVLIDVKDKHLQSSLSKVAASVYTQLVNLDEEYVSVLLKQSYPDDWKDRDVVTIPENVHKIPVEWFAYFWDWIQKYNLLKFKGTFIIPIVTKSISSSMKVTRLTSRADSPVVLITDNQCSEIMLNVLKKYGVLCTMLKYVPYLKHYQLHNFVNGYNPHGVLTAIFNSCPNVRVISLDENESCELQRFLASLNPCQVTGSLGGVLTDLQIFKITGQDKILSLHHATKCSWNKSVVMEPTDFSFGRCRIPYNLIILSRSNEVSLIKACSSGITFRDSQLDFILHELIPFIQCNQCPESDINALMECVLQQIPVV